MRLGRNSIQNKVCWGELERLPQQMVWYGMVVHVQRTTAKMEFQHTTVVRYGSSCTNMIKLWILPYKCL